MSDGQVLAERSRRRLSRIDDDDGELCHWNTAGYVIVWVVEMVSLWRSRISILAVLHI